MYSQFRKACNRRWILIAVLGLTAQAMIALGQASDEAKNAHSEASPQTLRRLIDMGRANEALGKIQTIRADGKPHAELSLLAALAYYAKGEMEAADKELAEVLRQQPADIEAKTLRGLVLVKLGRPAEAIPLLEAVAHEDAAQKLGKSDPNYALALCYMDTQRYDDARRAFAAQFGFPPESAQAYVVAARMLLRRDFVSVALEFAKKAATLEPTLPGVHQLIGEIALAQGRAEDAIQELQMERSRNPLDGAVYDRLGDALNRAGRFDEALFTLQEALLLEPNATGPYILLGQTMMNKHDAVSAAMYLERAARMDPDNYITHNLLGVAYRIMGRTDQANREIQIAHKLQNIGQSNLQTSR